MVLLSRLAGAILVEDGKDCFLVGDTKRPCDWSAAGFVKPPELKPLDHGPLQLSALPDRAQVPGKGRGPSHDGRWIEIACERMTSTTLCHELHSRLLIERNASVSERLWNLIVDHVEWPPQLSQNYARADWLVTTPMAIWMIIRDSLLRCV